MKVAGQETCLETTGARGCERVIMALMVIVAYICIHLRGYGYADVDNFLPFYFRREKFHTVVKW